jgi:hypothetical protein
MAISVHIESLEQQGYLARWGCAIINFGCID